MLFEHARALLRQRALRSEQDQPRDVPQLVRELAAFFDRPFREAHVLRRRHLHQAVAHRVGAVRVDDRQWVHAGPEAL